jgi:hypothetical protein
MALSVASVPALAGACGPTADPGAMAAVQIGGTGTPPPGCRMLAQLEGKDDDQWAPGGVHYEKAVLALRRQAVLGGGNYLFIDNVAPPRDTDYRPAFIIKARLFACPAVLPAAPVLAAAPSSATAPSPAAPPPVALACEPDCSPGYTCLRGTCVSACNPLCAAGERCGVDRICHPLATPPPSAP